MDALLRKEDFIQQINLESFMQTLNAIVSGANPSEDSATFKATSFV